MSNGLLAGRVSLGGTLYKIGCFLYLKPQALIMVLKIAPTSFPTALPIPPLNPTTLASLLFFSSVDLHLQVFDLLVLCA